MALCRLCIEEVESLLEIYGKFGKEQKISEMIGLYLRFEIFEDDPLSDKLCTGCWSKLIDFHTFYTQVQKAQERITIIEDMADDQRTEILIADNSSETDEITVIKTDDQNDNYEDFNNVDTVSVIDSNAVADAEMDSHDVRDSENLEIMCKVEDNQLTCPRSTNQDEELIYEYLTVSENPNTHSQQEETECDNDSPRYAKRRYLKRRQKRKTSSGDDTQGESTNDSPRKVRLNPTEQEKEQINLIESYFTMRCDLCQEDFEGFQTLFEHYENEHQLRGYIICCGKKFYRRPVIAEHVLWHMHPENFSCATCNIEFLNKRSYDNHMLVHAPPEVERYQCEHCPKTFAKKSKLEKHKLSHLRDDEKPCICDECDKPYASEALLRAHKRVVHLHTYAHMCEICAKVFKSRVFFEKHQLEHLGQNLPKVQCEKCGVWMKNEHTMRAHMRNHQDEGQDHFCDICGKKGPSRNAIAKHKRFVHFSERKFQCTFCNKAFKRAISLKEHLAVHTGEVLYKCSFCPKTFNSGANMHAHRKKVHPTEWLEDKQIKQDAMKVNEQKS